MTTEQKSLDEQIAELEAQRAALTRKALVRGLLPARPATEAEFDAGLLRALGQLLEQRLAAARTAGRHGWHDPDACPLDDLRAAFAQKAAEGDYLDAIAYGAMVICREAAE